MFPVIHLGRLAIQASGLMIILGLYLGITLAEHRLPKKGITVNQFYTIIFIALGVGVLGARLLFIFQNLRQFLASPVNIVSLDPNLLDPFGGVALAGIAVLIYGYRTKLQFWNTLDAFTPVLAVLTIFIGVSHLASGRAYGSPTNLPWGLNLWGDKRHPSQVYEILAGLIILIALWHRFGSQTNPGVTFLLFVTSTAGAHLLLEAWRGDEMLLVAGIRLTQWFAWLLMSICLFILDGKMVSHKPAETDQ